MKEKILSAKERLTAFFDAGTFVELGVYVRRPDAENTKEGVVCGYGSVKGELVFAFAQDATEMKGALDARHAKKIEAVYEKALKAESPVVGFFDCAGTVVFDGADGLAAYGKLLRTVSDASGLIPQIAVLCGNCTGSMAAVASLFDFTVAVKGLTNFAVSAPEVNAEAAFAAGNAELLAADMKEAIADVKKLISYLSDEEKCKDDINRQLNIPEKTTAANALENVVDAGSFFELFGGAAKELKAGFARLGGVSTLLFALDGELTLTAAEKMTALLRFADVFDFPVVTLLNCTGVAVAEAEEPRMAAALGALAYALAESDNSRVTAVVGSAVGAGFIFGAPKSLGTDVVFALPGSEIAALSAKSGVAFLWNDRITAEKSREELEAEWIATKASAESAAEGGEIDDIVAPAELRARIIAALYMLK